MKKLFQILFLSAILSIVFFSSCKESGGDDPVPGDNYTTLTTFMAANSMDLGDILTSWIVGPPASVDEVPAFISNYHIIDLRSDTHFAAGHIEGAVNSTLGNILTAAQDATKPILVVCYTGQTAGHAVTALRLSGYSDAKVLKWGMSGWNSSTTSWADNIGDEAVGHANWSATNSTASNETFDSPNLSATATDGAGILAERVTAMLNGGFKGVINTDVLGTPANYHINNFWDETDVDHYGHIVEAYRTKPLAISNMNNLDPNNTVVTYCWTGQTSSMVTAYLSVLGFDAKSLKFGTNGMIYSELESHKYTVPTVELPVVQN